MDSRSGFRRISSEEQKTLIWNAQHSEGAKSKEAKTLLLKAYEPLMRREIKLAHTPSTLYEDAIQAARKGCLEALGRFDLSREVAFGAYARPYIKGEVLRAVYKRVRRPGESAMSSSMVEYAVSLDRSVGDGSVNLGELLKEPSDDIASLEARSVSERVQRFLGGLTPRQRYIVRRVFYDEQTQSSVALELGVSGAAISRTLARTYARGRLELSELQETIAA